VQKYLNSKTLLLRKAIVDAFKKSNKSATFTQEEINIITPVFQEILPFSWL
jgi:hypothetical protein